MNRKHIIVGSILVIGAIMVGSSLAWWTWSTSSNEQTNVVVTVGGISINYEDGENITNNNLIPTSTKEQGISKDITVSSSGQVYLDLNMSIVTLDDGLKDSSFKYEIYDGTSLLKKGNFANNNIGDNISLLSGMEVTSTPVTYTLYIWIDGNMSNPNTMYNQNFEFRLNASATDEAVTITGVELADRIKNVVNTETPDFSQVATTNEGVFSAQDDYGTSYYFRGAVEYNYVEFAGFYWRIIRVNGDGAIRMIYDGTSAHANGESNTDRHIGTSAFNNVSDDATYVGYMYGEIDATNYEDSHSNKNDSSIKIVVDNWYKTNIADKDYGKYIADIIYCNDRSIYSGVGYAKQPTTYNATYRLITNKNPILTCAQQNDRFTVDDTSKGNGALTYPVGLITADEVVFAGIGNSSVDNTNYYLYSGYNYITMTPTSNSTVSSYVLLGNKTLFSNSILGVHGIRPVISLKSSVEFTGNGTMDSPFEVVS